ncbi:MAG TPA: hypothetical protein VK249_22195 [Anaerolineales bacterium]|nr:hypothetical protein [Anaerolineales bacterium]
MRKHWLHLCLTLFLIASFNFESVQADAGTLHTYIPIGSDYRGDTLQRFAQAAAQHDTNGTVDILVIPITFATDPFNISNGERQQNLTLADTRRGQVETACNAAKLPGQTCRALLAPVLVRSDAYLQANLDLFAPGLDGMYILGGDQTIAMQVVANTPFEERMASAFNAGAVVSGKLYRNHGLLGLGVDVNTAIEFTATGTNVWGKNTVVVFDGRYGTYAQGTNGALSERYILLDTYVEGDAIMP